MPCVYCYNVRVHKWFVIGTYMVVACDYPTVMQCQTCGEPLTMDDTTGGANPGESFVEYYECPHGHVATIQGTVGETDAWTRTNIA